MPMSLILWNRGGLVNGSIGYYLDIYFIVTIQQHYTFSNFKFHCSMCDNRYQDEKKYKNHIKGGRCKSVMCPKCLVRVPSENSKYRAHVKNCKGSEQEEEQDKEQEAAEEQEAPKEQEADTEQERDLGQGQETGTFEEVIDTFSDLVMSSDSVPPESAPQWSVSEEGLAHIPPLQDDLRDWVNENIDMASDLCLTSHPPDHIANKSTEFSFDDDMCPFGK